MLDQLVAQEKLLVIRILEEHSAWGWSCAEDLVCLLKHPERLGCVELSISSLCSNLLGLSAQQILNLCIVVISELLRLFISVFDLRKTALEHLPCTRKLLLT